MIERIYNMNSKEELKRKLVFDMLDVTIDKWLEFDINNGNNKKKFVERMVESGLVTQDELVDHFMYRIINL